MTNSELAEIFANIADLLEIKGEVVYKVLAYRKVAETLAEYGREVVEVWQAGQVRTIPGVGEAIAEKLDELLRTGKLAFYDKLKREVPVGLLEVLKVTDVGPKRAALFWKQLKITTVADLEAAARAGRLRDLAGLGEKTEAKILAGIEARKRLSGRVPLGRAWPLVQELLKFLRNLPGVEVAEVGGSVRRMRATIGDLDFLVGASETRVAAIMAAFTRQAQVRRVLLSGETKTSVELAGGLQADLRVVPVNCFGTALQYFTGSQAHNVHLREVAQSQGWSLSEYALTKKNGPAVQCATEAEVYQTLGLAYIPPELREDRGEIAAAAAGPLPRLIETRDVQSELHAHTTWSDGTASVRDMALAARGRGYRCLAITDHSQSLGVTGGLTPERLRAQRREIQKAQEEFGAGFSLLQGVEVEIHADGTLDYTDDVLGDLDIVVASLHSALRQPRQQITERLVHVMENRQVDIIGHPTGRLLGEREGADLDMEVVLRAAAECGVALEINAYPSRLDLDDRYARRAVELGCVLAINTDAHQVADLGHLFFGVGTARRAWVAPETVINTWPVEKLLHWLEERGHRSLKMRRSIELQAGEVEPSAIPREPHPQKPAAARVRPKSKSPAAKRAAAVKSKPKKK